VEVDERPRRAGRAMPPGPLPDPARAVTPPGTGAGSGESRAQRGVEIAWAGLNEPAPPLRPRQEPPQPGVRHDAMTTTRRRGQGLRHPPRRRRRLPPRGATPPRYTPTCPPPRCTSTSPDTV